MADKMRVEFRMPVDGFQRGQVVKLEESEAIRYMEGKCAVPVRGVEAEVADAPPPETADWDLKMEPEEYLERYPDGKHAEQARRIVEG